MHSATTPDASELEGIALEVAREAAKLVLGGFRGSHSVSMKPGNEPVTEFDLRSEELIRARLARLTPEIPVVGEELGTGGQSLDGGAAGLTWYCDPIDGTVNFMRGHPYFAVSLGVARGSSPVAGAIVAPALGIEWHGTTRGSRRNGTACQVSQTFSLDQAIVSVGSLEQVQPLVGRVRGFRLCGSAAIELCMVADGTYDVYWSPALNPWDICAGGAILLGAGGRWQRRGAPGPLTDLGCGPGLFAALDELVPA
jgi:myo-inositol-1(or 4)-monophosphatase